MVCNRQRVILSMVQPCPYLGKLFCKKILVIIDIVGVYGRPGKKL